MVKRADKDARAPGTGTVASVTIGSDGRLYCHDLTPELLAVLAELCRPDAQLAVRQAAARAMEPAHE
jgi:hypothetical protein